MTKPTYGVFAASLAAWLLFDQITKGITTTYFRLGEETQIIEGWLSWTHAQNTGAAFSSLDGAYWLFLGFGFVATLVVGDLLRRLRSHDFFTAFVLAMVLSGAWGICLDRIRLGHVTDFIRVYTEHPDLAPWFVDRFGTATWPIFNIADSALLVGLTLYLAHYLFLEDTDEDLVDEEFLVG